MMVILFLWICFDCIVGRFFISNITDIEFIIKHLILLDL